MRKAYFADPWNRFDFVIVIGSFLGLLMLWTVGSSYGSIATVIRIFRIGRVLRLVRGLESMAQLFNTLLLTLPSLGNVGALLCLLFFIYAAMGVQLFAKVMRYCEKSHNGGRVAPATWLVFCCHQGQCRNVTVVNRLSNYREVNHRHLCHCHRRSRVLWLIVGDLTRPRRTLTASKSSTSASVKRGMRKPCLLYTSPSPRD